MAFPATESPLRLHKRSPCGRAAAAIRSLTPSGGPGRYVLYIALLLVGYLAGTTVRLPYYATPPLLSELPTVAPMTANAAARGASGRASVSGAAAAGRGAVGAVAQSTKLSGVFAVDPVKARSGGTRRQAAEQDPAAAAAAAVRQADAAGLLAPANRTLRFQVCNGFANQRLSVMYGALLAVRLGRSLVLPVLIDNGLQRSDSAVLASGDNEVSFSEMYDQPYFVRTMAAAGLRVLASEDAPSPSSYTTAPLAEYGWSVAAPLAERFAGTAHLAVDCPLFKMTAADMAVEDWELMWSVLEALRPNERAAALIDRVVANIAAAHSGGSGGKPGAAAAGGSSASGTGFNFLHLRIENDWVAHCRRWESINDGLVRDNCFTHTDDIGARLALFGLSNGTTLYVGSYWDDVDKERREKAFAQLAAAGYRIVTSADVLPPPNEDDGHGAAAAAAATSGLRGEPAQLQQQQGGRRGRGLQGAAGGVSSGGRGREYAAMIEYFVGMRANRFIGNSVSTFAALGLLERRHAGLWAAYYNGGNIPLASLLPGLHRLPWVFTYNSWSPDYEYMLKGAVRSALATRSLAPYCIFQGNTSSPIATWLEGQGVTLISHTPTWREALLAKARSRAKDNVHHSHLFKTPDMLVSTFQRVDLPVVPLLDQYTYVLYTDADVYFRRPMRLDDFGLPLPHSVSMSYEFVDMFPYNAGVIVANLPTMRTNYAAFISMMLDNDNGLYYTNYGPADQGIMNKFYENDLRARMLSQVFNTKPYSAFDPAAFIVHFHGPKPHQLLDFLTTGKCDFFTVCESAFLNGLCSYTSEWVQWVYDDVESLRLEDACAWLATPAVAQLFKQKWGLQGDMVAAGAAAGAAGVPAANRTEFAQVDDLRALTRATAAVDADGASPNGTASNGEAAEEEPQNAEGPSSGGPQAGGDAAGGRVGRLRRALQQRVQQREEREAAEAAGSAAAAAASRHARQQHRQQHLGTSAGSGAGPGASEGEQQGLMDFDRFQAVTANEEELEEAWETPAESAGGAGGDGGGGRGR